MQKNKYLDDLGLKPNEYGTNFIGDDDKRSSGWAEEKELYGFDSRETWCLSHIFVEWLYSHCMMYKERASEMIDLTWHKLEYNGKEYSQLEAIDYIIKCTKAYLTEIDEESWTDKEIKLLEKVQDATRLWAVLFPFMWW